MTEDGERGGERPGPAAVLMAAFVVYSLLLGLSLLWLHWRDRLALVPAAALGDHGLLPSAGIGLGAGLAGTMALALAARCSGVRRCELRVAGLLGRLSDGHVIALSTVAAIAEELFFRLAVQDAFGPLVAVACYVVLNTGPGFWPWLPVALAGAVMFSSLVHFGFGLLSATLAHALINYLALRRILPT